MSRSRSPFLIRFYYRIPCRFVKRFLNWRLYAKAFLYWKLFLEPSLL
jgi:hypothetical protein